MRSFSGAIGGLIEAFPSTENREYVVITNESTVQDTVEKLLSTHAHKCPWCGADPVQKQYNEDGVAFCTRCLHRAI